MDLRRLARSVGLVLAVMLLAAPATASAAPDSETDRPWPIADPMGAEQARWQLVTAANREVKITASIVLKTQEGKETCARCGPGGTPIELDTCRFVIFLQVPALAGAKSYSVTVNDSRLGQRNFSGPPFQDDLDGFQAPKGSHWWGMHSGAGGAPCPDERGRYQIVSASASLDDTPRILGTVTDADGKAVKGVRVTARGPGGASDKSDGAGAYSMKVKKGSYKVSAKGYCVVGPKGCAESKSVNVKSGAKQVDFRAPPKCEPDPNAKGASDRLRVAQTAPADCPELSVKPVKQELTQNDAARVSGAGWDPNGNDVLLFAVNGKKVLGALGSARVDKSGRLDEGVIVREFSRRGKVVEDGCAFEVRAQQGKLRASATAHSDALGFINVALNASPWKSGDVYCQGEDPIGEAGSESIVIAAPVGQEIEGLDGVKAYNVAAEPHGVSLLGGPSTDLGLHAKSRKATVYVSGNLCVGSPGLFTVVRDPATVGNNGSAPCAPGFPAVPGNMNPSVRERGFRLVPQVENDDAEGFGCFDLAFSLLHPAPRRLVGNFDCKLEARPIELASGRVGAPLFVDGSLRVSPFLAVTNELVTAGSLEALAGMEIFGEDRVVTGGDASFVQGPKNRAKSPGQKNEIQALIDQQSMTNDITGDWGMATSAGAYGAEFLKQTGGKFGGAVFLLNNWLNWTSGKAAKALETVKNDPPDSSFKVVATPRAAKLPSSVEAGDDLPSAVAREITRLLKSMARETALGEALATALNRAGGAAAAGATKSEKKQIAAAVKYIRSLAKLLSARPKLLKAAASALGSHPAGRYRPTREDYEAARTRLRDEGFTPELLEFYKSAGDTPEQIELRRRLLLVQPIAPSLTAAEIIGDAKLATGARRQAKALLRFAKSAPTTVGPPKK